HTYSRPGNYQVTIRVTNTDGRLFEYTVDIAVSKRFKIKPPLMAFPNLSFDVAHQTVVARTRAPDGESVTAIWQLGGRPPEQGKQVKFLKLPTGNYQLTFTAVRDLSARVYNRQRYAPTGQVIIPGLRAATNRVFDGVGHETTTPTDYNAL